MSDGAAGLTWGSLSKSTNNSPSPTVFEHRAREEVRRKGGVVGIYIRGGHPMKTKLLLLEYNYGIIWLSVKSPVPSLMASCFCEGVINRSVSLSCIFLTRYSLSVFVSVFIFRRTALGVLRRFQCRMCDSISWINWMPLLGLLEALI